MGSEGCKGPDPAVMNLKDNWKIQSSALAQSSGSSISVNDFPAEKWYPASVPGTVLANLVDNKVYSDPYYGEILNQFPGIRLAAGSQWIRKVPSILHGGTVPVLRYLQSGKDRT